MLQPSTHARSACPYSWFNRRSIVRRTNSLDRLVDSYLEAKAKLSRQEFEQLEIKVVRLGKLKLKDYFSHISHTSGDANDRIIYGGAYFDKRFGKGFRFKFIDRSDDLPIFLYVSSKLMEAYRFRGYIEEVLSKVDRVRYITLYAIGALEKNSTGKSLNLNLENLRHLTLILGPPKTLP